MKLNKIYAIALAALSLTACSDSDDDNGLNSTPGVTVQMQEQTLSFGEDMQQGVYYKIPVIVTGNASGLVQVNVEITGTGTTPATEGEDFVVTSKTINIAPDTKIGYVEFYPVGDDVINENRQFIATITSAKGASVGTESTCIVTLVDNESLLPKAYQSILGSYTVTANDQGAAVDPFTINVTGVSEGEEGYLTTVTISNFYDPDFEPITCSFAFDAVSGTGSIGIPLGVIVGGPWNFGAPVGTCMVGLGSVSGSTLVNSGYLYGKTDVDFKTVTFDGTILGALWSYPSGTFTGYTYFWFDDMVFTKQ
ncbi:MAG: hypothetical protein HDS21_03310 [Bacteroides sp.]|nr:hypothetical protein [Bacteroides sp.]